MKNRTWYIFAFIAVAIAQLYIPYNMIVEREAILQEGKVYKFKSRPIDPYDPFRGKYITLSFENRVRVDTALSWEKGEEVYASIEEDEDGWAYIKSLSKDIPQDNSDYFITRIRHFFHYSNKATIEIPFNRFYMEESLAKDAEVSYNKVRWSREGHICPC